MSRVTKKASLLVSQIISQTSESRKRLNKDSEDKEDSEICRSSKKSRLETEISPNINTQIMWEIINNAKYNNNRKYMSATKTANYLLDDPLLDWLDLYYNDYGLNNNGNKQTKEEIENNKKFLQVYFDGGLAFEEKVMKSLKDKFGEKFIMLKDDARNGITEEDFNITIKAIKSGFPIIAQAVLFNNNNMTRGIADLLVRSDYVNELVKEPVLSEEEKNIKAPKLNGNYHYVVIDIKWSTLHFSSKNNTVLKIGRIPAYKGQLAIYNCALGNIQGYYPDKAFLLGKGWKREKTVKRETETEWNMDCFDKLGIIDYSDIDNIYIKKTADAIKWYHDVSVNGKSWSPLNPPNENMYPNMSNDDLVWGGVKKEIAEKIGEVTKICHVGIKERKELHKKGIYSCYDPRCTSQNMRLGATETASKINAILDINRDDRYNIYPRTIINNMRNWQEQSPVDFYFDFETLNEQFCKNYKDMDINDNTTNASGLIFEIGVGWIEKDSWKFKKFYIDKVSQEEEGNIIDEFYKFILSKSLELDPQKKYYPRLFHWTNAERNNLKDANYRHNGKFSEFVGEVDVKFVDMFKVFSGGRIINEDKNEYDEYEPIAIKGAFNYKLKTIGKALHNLGKIQTQWPDTNITNGQIAMLEAIKYYKNKMNNCLTEKDNKVFDDIIKYNEIDCKMIWEIVSYFRTNHNDLDKDE
jgi:hypothetical protein